LEVVRNRGRELRDFSLRRVPRRRAGETLAAGDVDGDGVADLLLGGVDGSVTLADAQGRIVGRRDLGNNVCTGCCGPTTVNLAVREPGQYVLGVCFSDGHERKWPADLREQKRLFLEADRGQAVAADRDAGSTTDR
jgi:hypothetical protein